MPPNDNKDEAMLGDSGHERIENDFYETPEWVTEILLKHVAFTGTVWEPAVGKGAMAVVLKRHNYRVCCSDLIDRGDIGFPYVKVNFLNTGAMLGGSENICTNPPYGDAAEHFVEHALKLLPRGGKLVLICRHEWICAKKRKYLFDKESALSKVIILNKRPKWIKGSTGSPRHNYAIYVFEKSRIGSHAEIIIQ